MEAVYRRLETFFATKENAPLTPAEAAVCVEWIDALCSGSAGALWPPAQSEQPHYMGDSADDAAHTPPAHVQRSTLAVSTSGADMVTGLLHDMPDRERSQSAASFATAASGPPDHPIASQDLGASQDLAYVDAASASLEAIPEHREAPHAHAGDPDAQSAGSSSDECAFDPAVSELRRVQNEIRSMLEAGDTATEKTDMDISLGAPHDDIKELPPAPAEAPHAQVAASKTALEILRALDGSSSDSECAIVLPAPHAGATATTDQIMADSLVAETSGRLDKAEPSQAVPVFIEPQVRTPARNVQPQQQKGTPVNTLPVPSQTVAAALNPATETPGRTPRRTPRTTPLPRSLDSSPQDAIVHIDSSSEEERMAEEGGADELQRTPLRQDAQPQSAIPILLHALSKSDPGSLPPRAADDVAFPFDLSSVSERRFPATDDVPEFAFDV